MTAIGGGLSGKRDGLLRAAARRLHGRGSVISAAAQQDITYINESGLFDRNGYLRRYPDVAQAGMDPVVHYVQHGATEGRSPCDLFDTKHYIENNPDVAASGMNPFRHFCEFGWKEWRNPSQSFDMAKYAASHMADLAGTVNPLEHRLANPPSDGGKRKSDVEIVVQSGLFDAEYYLRMYPEVAKSGADPVVHYVKYGAKRGRNPSPLFDAVYYMEKNRDVAASGMDPFRHFCEFGWKELRNPSIDFDIAWYWLVHMLPLGADGNPLLHYRQVGQPAGLRARAVGELSAAEESELGALADAMLEREWNDASVYTRLGLVLTSLKRWAAAESAFRGAVGIDWDVAKSHNQLAHVLVRQSKWWQAAESLITATALAPSRASWFYRLGEVQEKMNRFALAAVAYRQAVELDPEPALHWYRLGYAHESANQHDKADFAYLEAIRRDSREDVKRFGVGVYHQERGYWKEARNAYALLTKKTPLDAELRYRMGMAHDRCYEWGEARAAYELAIALNPRVPYWHYRLGFVLERLQKWGAAAEAYGAAAMMSEKHVSYWHYRCAYVLQSSGDYERACHAYLKTRAQHAVDDMRLTAVSGGTEFSGRESLMVKDLPETASQSYLRKFPKLSIELIKSSIINNRINANWHYMLGQAHERLNDWGAAECAYADAVARKDDHEPEWYYRLGFVRFQAGRYAEACDAFQETKILRRPYGVDSSRYTKNPEQKDLMEYNEYLEVLPVLKNTILYESYAGVSVSDNPRAIFDFLLADPARSEWRHVWVLDDLATIPNCYLCCQNVIFVRRNTDLYRRYLATASYLVNNATFPAWFMRRPEQKYLNTWHGTPLKTLGMDIKGSFMERKNTARNFLHCTHIISPNVHTSDVLLKRYDIASIYSGRLAETGYPRIDRLVRATADTKAALLKRLGLVDGLPVVLYAPTWRGTLGDPRVETERLMADMATLAGFPCQVVFRGHYFAERQLAALELPITIAPQDIEACDLLSITDVLITDYSSIFFDFITTGRPILYYAYDLDQYVEERGLYFNIESMPGTLCKTMQELTAALEMELAELVDRAEAYFESRERFCLHDDGQATRRTVEFFIEGSEEYIVDRYMDTKRSLLFFAGAFPPQGITASALNLLRSLDAEVDVATLIIDPNVVGADAQKLERFSHVPDSVHVIGRCGTMVQSPEERWVRESLNRRHSLTEPAMQSVYMKAFRRDYFRIFGGGHFDVIVNLDGYSVYWAALLAAGADSATRKVIYMHSDMRAEYELRFPNLSGLFMVYKNYDVLVSVSEVMRNINRDHLSSALGLDQSKFKHCINTINMNELAEKAKAPLDADLESWLAGSTTFLSLGRLSPEKGYAKLIRAFSAVHSEHPETRLLILGHGPLKHDLQALIATLGLGDAVFLAGLRTNPFPLLSRCDCFVLSSDHEGQPMVLLEAMAFGRPIIATDIDGNRGVLKSNQYGLLVDNSADGLAQGMRMFIAGKVPSGEFDSQRYQMKALNMFHEVVVGEGESGQCSVGAR